MKYINHPVNPRFILNAVNNTSNISTNESNDCDEINKRYLTPKNINHFDRNFFYTQQKINFQKPSFFGNNNNNNSNNMNNSNNNQQNQFEDM